MRKNKKRFLSLLLAASMILANTGTAFARDLGKPSVTEEGKTATVTLDPSGGGFKASPSNASPSDATLSDAEKAPVKVTVPLDTALHHSLGSSYFTRWEAVQNSDDFPAAPIKKGYIFDGWYADLSNPASKMSVDDYIFEDSTVYARWVKEAAGDYISGGAGAIIASGLGENGTLTINRLTSDKQKTGEELNSAIEGNTLGYRDLDLDSALQLDIDVSNHQNGSPVTITMPIPEGFDRDKAFVIIHFKASGNAEIIVPTVNIEASTLTFTLTSFSPVIIASADRLCTVKVEDVKGGFINAYTITSLENDSWTKTYLPIGEEVKIPYGTDLYYGAEATDEGDDWRAVFNRIDITVGGVASTNYVIEADYFKIQEDTTLKAEFVKCPIQSGGEEEAREPYLSVYADDYNFEASQKVETKLTARLHDGAGKYMDVTEDATISLSPVNGEGYDNSLFTLRDNILSSNEALSLGFYEVLLTVDYHDGSVPGEGEVSIYLAVGYSDYSFYIYLAERDDGYYDESLLNKYYYDDGFFPSSESSKTLDQVISESIEWEDGCDFSQVGMYNYDFAGWYDMGGTSPRKVSGNAILPPGYYDLMGMFSKNGKLYQKTIQGLDSETPGPDPANPGGSGGGSSNTGLSNMTGTWMHDEIGWWFKKTDGSFAQSQWGLINGKWYQFNDVGYMVTGWTYSGGRWYYLDESGAMLISVWIQIQGKWYYLGTDGGMLSSQWLLYNGAWYYLGSDGAMLVDTVTPDGLSVDENGVWIP